MTRRPTSLPLNLFNTNLEIGRTIRLGDTRADVQYYRLLEGDDYCDEGFPGCQFRLPFHLCEIAVNVTVTGKVARWFDGSWNVRVKVEFVGDCAPSTFTNGWLVLES